MAGREEEEDVEANPVFQAMRRPPGLLYDRAARQVKPRALSYRALSSQRDGSAPSWEEP